MNNGDIQKIDLGRQIYATNMAIHLGKNSVGAVIANKPVDEVVLADERASLHALRLGRNALLMQLNSLKVAEPAYALTTWMWQ
jgi:hypothetical protein